MSISAIVVEDGTKVTGANSYVTVAELVQYGKDRQHVFLTAPNVLLLKAMDYIESLRFQGIKLTKDQPLQWPRGYVVIDQYAIDTDEIPQALKNGLMQTAISIDEGYDPLAIVTQSVRREKVDVIEIEYAANNPVSPIIKKINSCLYKLLQSGSGTGSNITTVSRG